MYATIGTFFKDGDSYRGIINTRTTIACATITPDGDGSYTVNANGSTIGRALRHSDGTLTVILDPAIHPGRATLVERDGVHVLML